MARRTAKVSWRWREVEAAQRPRVEAGRADSGQLARLMFLRGRTLSALGNTVARFVPLRAALRPVVELLQQQPRPHRLAASAS